jgi:two-component system, NtrC family, response regulator
MMQLRMAGPPRVLIIDDDKLVGNAIANVAKTLGCTASMALTLKDGLDLIGLETFDIVFLDVYMPDGNGIEMLPRINAAQPGSEVIVVTAYGDPESVEKALSNGAWDYIEKPFSKNDFAQLLKDALAYHASRQAPKATIDFRPAGIIGGSPRMRECLTLLNSTVNSDANVLLTGETGTGKELFARAIHAHSSRAGYNFMVVDCTALPPLLVESILFGHEKGSYTGADKTQQGLIIQAHQGTLFLDEVGELPLVAQKKFLRILQEGRFRPVGKTTEVESDFRVVAATNRSLDELVKSGRFRHDLLFRLQSITIHLPPLRERSEDILDLTKAHLEMLYTKYRMKPKRLSAAFSSTLEQYAWPGNVRELHQTLESALSMAHDSPILVPKHLPGHIHTQVKSSRMRQAFKPEAARVDFDEDSVRAMHQTSLKEVRDQAISRIEQQYLQDLMQHTKAKVRMACKISGLSRSRLYALLKKYQIPIKDLS